MQDSSVDRRAAVLARQHVTLAGPADGRPLVFAHGFGCDQAMWGRVAPSFVADHRVVLFDHVGAGGSDLGAYDERRYDALTGYAEDLAELCEVLDLRDAVVVAHSVGAMIAVLAAPRTDRIGALVLVGPSPRYIDDPSAGYVGGFSRDDVEGLLEVMSSNYLGWTAAMGALVMGQGQDADLTGELTASFCRTDPAIARHFAQVTFLSDNRADLERVAVPTLVVQSSRDDVAPPVVGAYVRDRIPGAELVVVDTLGHCPHLSAPAETVEHLRSFLERTSRSGAAGLG